MKLLFSLARACAGRWRRLSAAWRDAAGAWAGVAAWVTAALLAGLLLGAGPAQASHPAHPAYVLGSEPSGPLGGHASYFMEPGPALSLGEARLLHAQDRFVPHGRPVVSLGIGTRPVWVHLRVHNPESGPQPYRLVAGAPWIDQLDVAVVQAGRVHQAWRTGDAFPGAAQLAPGVGFAFAAEFPPGTSDVFVRAQTADPLVLPLTLVPQHLAADEGTGVHYSYGLLYGALLALIGVNLLLGGSLGARGHGRYAVYLLSFIALNLSYTGHGLAWWWPAQPGLQRFVILGLMVGYGCAGFWFAARFLDLATQAPRVLRGLQALCGGALAAFVLLVALGSQRGAALLAFSFLVAAHAGMLGLGLLALRRQHPSAHYFLAAALCGVLGVGVTTLAVWGWLPLTPLTYRSAELGVVLEAMLLALALASRMRSQDRARLHAERLAGQDSLTGLPNRRAFFGAAAGPWNIAVRRNRPLAVVVLDIDHFKAINDQYGHEAGDRALVEVARRLAGSCRAGDVLARWGGEEFVLLLPETDLAQACALAERIRQALERQPVPHGGRSFALTASCGVAQRLAHGSLEALIREADEWLYCAKREGRNRVAAATPGRAQPGALTEPGALGAP